LTGCLSGYEFPVTRSVPSDATSGKIGAPEDLPALVIDAGLRIATAESLTGGLLASSFAEMSGASRFFVGGIVAYSADVKFGALGVTPGPVVNQRAAAEMALGAKRLLGADIVVAVTGVGGPGRQEGQPPGTAHVAIAGPDDAIFSAQLHIDGPPETVCRATCEHCIGILREFLNRWLSLQGDGE
jgi:nicotinamide-nucleotide amidase